MNTKLYSLISKARESCAGSNVQEIDIVKRLLNEAIAYCSKDSIGLLTLGELNRAKYLLDKVKDYGDRLVPDIILCDILNKMLKDE
jgi:hypothetical protein